MKEKVEILIANLRDDLNSIDKMKAEYDLFIRKLESRNPDIYQKMVIGYFLHNFYNATENIFINIAKTFENNIEPGTWHKSILKRMKLHIDDIRPAVISQSFYMMLDDFRAFRYVFRHVYSFELDWQKEKIVADKFDFTVQQFKREINKFIQFLKELDDKPNN